jgi:hypothetical protein
MSTDIPRARKELKEIAAGLDDLFAAAAILSIVDTLMVRTFSGRKTRAKHQRMNDEIAERVRRFAAERPDLSQVEIGRMFNINGGRVSEALAGKTYDASGRVVREDINNRRTT